MPTVAAPANTAPTPVKPTTPPPAPPKPMSTTKQTPPPPVKPATSETKQKLSDGTIATILFVIAALLLCGLLGFALYRSLGSTIFSVAAPTLDELPQYTNTSAVTVKGHAPKDVDIAIDSPNGTVTTKSDKDGNFSTSITVKDEGTATFVATASKTVLFKKSTSPKSNTVSTTIDRTAPSMKVVTLPGTVSNPSYKVQGSVSEKAAVAVNVNGTEIPATVDDKNNFSVTITFIKGANNVTIVARDLAGNETATSPVTVTYTTGTISKSGSTSGSTSTLPNSAGELSSALGTTFGRYIALGALVLGMIGFGATSSTIWIAKQFKKQ